MNRVPIRRRCGALALLLVLLATSIAYVRFAAAREADKGRQEATATGLPEATEVAAASDDAVILTVNRSPGSAYGTVAALDPDGTARTFDNLVCERVHVGSDLGACLKPTPAPSPGLDLSLEDTELVLFDARTGAVGGSYPVAGRPSRLRMSADDRYAAYTTFVTGHSYAVASNLFSTNPVIVDTASGLHRWLETFAVVDHRGQTVDDPTRNYWGISFSPVDSDTFYAALGIGEENWLIEGSVTEQRAQVIATGLMCPSASPDGRHLVARDRTNGGRYAIYDLETGTHRPLTEDGVVDDQVEWLDDHTVAYAIEREDGPANQPVFDIWTLDVVTGERRELAVAASSPATVRT